MGILFTAPQDEYKIIEDEWKNRLSEISKKGIFVGGPEVANFEKKFAEYLNTPYVSGVGNGTDALFLALLALGVGPGDEVITVANTFIATVEAIHQTGAKPVLVDCDAESYLIDLDQVRNKITKNTKAIIVVHLYGQIVDFTSLKDEVSGENIYIIEDTAQAAGAKLKDKYAGTLGNIGCYSFYPDKNLGALGDGGCVSTDSLEIINKINMLKNHGGTARYEHKIAGYNSRLDPIQTSALSLKLDKLNLWNEKRRVNARNYEIGLKDIPGIILPSWNDDESHVFHLYVVRILNGLRTKVKKHLLKKGILTGIHYPTPIHLTEAFGFLGYKQGDFPNSEEFAEQILSLPMHISLNEDDISFICDELKYILNENNI